MNWNDVKSTIGKVLPIAASALFSPVAGAAVSGLCNVLGLSDNSSPDQIIDAFKSATPEQLLKAKELEASLKIEASRQQVDLERIAADDRANARQLAVLLAQAGKYDWTPRFLAIGALNGFLLLGGLFCWLKNDPTDVTIIKEMITIMGTLLTFCFGFYFGSMHKPN
jgi:hypothetical protein